MINSLQYAKVTAGLRQPNRILDVQQKLVFIYPILYCDKIKEPAQSFANTLRDFITVTFLSDLFVQNALSTISLANQISPIWDEERKPIDKTVASLKSYDPSLFEKVPSKIYPISPNYKYEISQKLTEKTAIIHKLIKTDPKLTKLRPHIEIVTLGNMIDVPIIMGTSYKPIDTLSLTYVLIAAIGLGKKLNREADIKTICSELRKMTPDKYWKLLQNLFDNPKTDSRFFSRILSTTKKISSLIPLNIRNKFDSLMKYFRLIRSRNAQIRDEDQNSIFEPLILNKDQIFQIENLLTSVNNNVRAMKDTGIGVGENNSNAVSTINLSNDFQMIVNDVLKYFEEYNTVYFLAFLTSVSKLITCSQVNLLDIKDQFSDAFGKTFYTNIQNSLVSIFEDIDNIFNSSGIIAIREQLKYLQRLSSIKSNNTLTDFFKKLPKVYINTVEFKEDDFNGFATYVDQFGNTGLNLSKRIIDELEYVLKKISNDSRPDLIAHILSHFGKIDQEIDNALNKISNFFNLYLQDVENEQALPAISLLIKNLNIETVKNKMLPSLLGDAKAILKFLFYSQVQMSLLSSVETIDVKLKTKSYELTDWPNYFLVLPVEIISALYSATAGFNWKKMLQSDIAQNKSLEDKRKKGQEIPRSENIRTTFNLNDNYIKGIIRFIVGRLDIPNLIVVDSEKSEVFCKLMNQSDVIKMKVSTMETFIKSKLDKII